VSDLVWPIEPDAAFTRQFVRRAVQSPASGGFVQRRRRTDRELPVCILRWQNVRQSTIYAIEQVWALTKRGVLPVLYTPPGETQGRFHMVGPMGYRLTNGTFGSIEVTLEALR
jgi:hypothetical protein